MKTWKIYCQLCKKETDTIVREILSASENKHYADYCTICKHRKPLCEGITVPKAGQKVERESKVVCRQKPHREPSKSPTKLLPCPFCHNGGNPHTWKYYDKIRVSCTDCGATADIIVWNQRATVLK